MRLGRDVFFVSPHTPYGRVQLTHVRTRKTLIETLIPRFTDFFTDFEKKLTVLQSSERATFLVKRVRVWTSGRRVLV